MHMNILQIPSARIINNIFAMAYKFPEAYKKVTTEEMLRSEQEKEAGNAYTKASDYEKAFDCYSRAISLNPSNPILYCNRSFIYLKAFNYTKVIEDCTKSIILKEGYLRAYQRRAKAYAELKNYGNALKDLRKVIESDIDDIDSLKDFQMCTEKIIEENRKKILSPRESPAKPQIKTIEDRDEFFDNEEVVNTVLQNAFIGQESSTKHQISGFYSEAITESQLVLEDIINLTPKNPTMVNKAKSDIYATIAICYFKKQDFAKAIEYFTVLSKLDLNDAHLKVKALMHRGFSYELLGKYEFAYRDMEEILKVHSKNKQAAECLEKYKSIMDGSKVTVRVTEKAYEKLLKNIGEHKEKGNKYFKDSNFKQAIDEFTFGINETCKEYTEAALIHESELMKVLIMLYNNRALVYYKQNRIDLAVQDCMHVFRIDRKNGKALFRLAKCFESCKNYSDAFKTIQVALEGDMNNTVLIQEYNNYSKFVNFEEKKNTEQSLLITNTTEPKKTEQKIEDLSKNPEKNSKIPESLEIKPTQIEAKLEKIETKVLETKAKPVNRKLKQINLSSSLAAQKYSISHEIPSNSSKFSASCQSLTDPNSFYEYLKVIFT